MITIRTDPERLKQIVSLGGDYGKPLKAGIAKILKAASDELQSSLPKRSGRWARSWMPRRAKTTRYKLEKTKTSARGVMGSKLHYDLVRRLGATIRPKRAKLLAIPLPAALNPRGLPRKRSPTKYKNLTMIKSKAGNLLLVRIAKSGKMTPFYVLKESVSQPGTHNVRNALRSVKPKVPRLMDGEMQAHIDEHLKGFA